MPRSHLTVRDVLTRATGAGVAELAVDRVCERVELAVVDARVNALPELASGRHRSAVDFDHVAHSGLPELASGRHSSAVDFDHVAHSGLCRIDA